MLGGFDTDETAMRDGNALEDRELRDKTAQQTLALEKDKLDASIQIDRDRLAQEKDISDARLQQSQDKLDYDVNKRQKDLIASKSEQVVKIRGDIDRAESGMKIIDDFYTKHPEAENMNNLKWARLKSEHAFNPDSQAAKDYRDFDNFIKTGFVTTILNSEGAKSTDSNIKNAKDLYGAYKTSHKAMMDVINKSLAVSHSQNSALGLAIGVDNPSGLKEHSHNLTNEEAKQHFRDMSAYVKENTPLIARLDPSTTPKEKTDEIKNTISNGALDPRFKTREDGINNSVYGTTKPSLEDVQHYITNIVHKGEKVINNHPIISGIGLFTAAAASPVLVPVVSALASIGVTSPFVIGIIEASLVNAGVEVVQKKIKNDVEGTEGGYGEAAGEGALWGGVMGAVSSGVGSAYKKIKGIGVGNKAEILATKSLKGTSDLTDSLSELKGKIDLEGLSTEQQRTIIDTIGSVDTFTTADKVKQLVDKRNSLPESWGATPLIRKTTYDNAMRKTYGKTWDSVVNRVNIIQGLEDISAGKVTLESDTLPKLFEKLSDNDKIHYLPNAVRGMMGKDFIKKLDELSNTGLKGTIDKRASLLFNKLEREELDNRVVEFTKNLKVDPKKLSPDKKKVYDSIIAKDSKNIPISILLKFLISGSK